MTLRPIPKRRYVYTQKGITRSVRDGFVVIKTVVPIRGAPLTDREKQVLLLFCEGHCRKEIAHRLSISMGTVEKYFNFLYGKSGSHCYVDLLRWAIANHLYTVPLNEGITNTVDTVV